MYGLCWFLCLPLLVLLAALLPPYRRHQLVAGGAIVLQAAALARDAPGCAGIASRFAARVASRATA